jgi:alanine racemase
VVPAQAGAAVADAASWLEIGLATLVANARNLAAKAAPATLCAVVKSNAYGHGLVPVARALAGAGIPGLRLAVFTLSEGFALREAGLDLPILVVGPAADGELAEAARERLELALVDETSIEPFAQHRITTHLKIETGTHRFGIAPGRAGAVLERCSELGMNTAAIYSHLASAEDIDLEFTMAQVAALKEARSKSAPQTPMHIAASAAAMMWPQARLDMVRCGIALYGAWPSPQVQAVMAGEDPSFALQPALRWFAPVVHVTELRPGESAGYSRAFVAQRESRIAVLPAGYADGLPRAAGGGRMQVRLGPGPDRRAPIVGRICMNACMLDVTDLMPPPALGDRAEIDIEALARAAATLNYEILARLPAHVERRYA